MKEWFGENATVDNDYGYDWWPKVPSEPGAQDYTHISTFELMDKGVMKGLLQLGHEPLPFPPPNAGFVRRSMAKLDWLVVADQVATESATFWKAPDMDPASIDTTVYFLPCALIYEKPGTILNSAAGCSGAIRRSSRGMRPSPTTRCATFCGPRSAVCTRREGGANPAPILNTKWDYYVDGKIDPRPVTWALNGYKIEGTDCNTTSANPKTDLLPGYAQLKADGSTACAMWIYSGFWSNNEAPLDAAEQPIGRRDNSDSSGIGLNSSGPTHGRTTAASCTTAPPPT